MGRISDKSRLFREKEQICADIAHVLADRLLSLCAKFAVVDQAIWIWSEYDGKYEGCRWRSVKACNGDDGTNDPLIHEHPVPRKVIRDMLFELQAPTPQNVRAVMDKFCLGVVIRKSEDVALTRKGLRAAMPHNWDRKDPFARYREVGLEIVES